MGQSDPILQPTMMTGKLSQQRTQADILGAVQGQKMKIRSVYNEVQERMRENHVKQLENHLHALRVKQESSERLASEGNDYEQL